MPQIYNPTTYELFCRPLRRVLRAGEVAAATDEQARAVDSNTVFVVTGFSGNVAPPAPERSAPGLELAAQEDADVADEHTTADDDENSEGQTQEKAPARRGRPPKPRGVETTDTPDRETR